VLGKAWKGVLYDALDARCPPVCSGSATGAPAAPTELQIALRAKTRLYCERFVFGKLYSSMFQGDFEDCFLNQKLSERVASLAFLQPVHLDVDPSRLDGPVAERGAGDTPAHACVAGAAACLGGLADATCPSDKVRACGLKALSEHRTFLI
jgi:hypothetical protein